MEDQDRKTVSLPNFKLKSKGHNRIDLEDSQAYQLEGKVSDFVQMVPIFQRSPSHHRYTTNLTLPSNLAVSSEKR